MYFLQMIALGLMLSLASSIDCFVSGFAFGSETTRISKRVAFAIAMICTIFLGGALLLGSLIKEYVPTAQIISLIILLGLGLYKILCSIIKAVIDKNNGFGFDFSLFGAKIQINLTSIKEENTVPLTLGSAVALGVALSLDGLAIGLGAGLDISLEACIVAIALSFVTGFAFLIFGNRLGNHLSTHRSVNLSWLGGTLLVALAISKMFL